MPTARDLVIELSIMVAIGVLLAALGPFGSFTGSFASRLAYWLPAVLIGYAIFRPLTFVSRWIAERLHLPLAAALYAGMIVSAIPATLAIAMLGGFRIGQMAPFEQLFQLYLNVALVGVVIATIFQLIEAARAPRAPMAEITGPVPPGPVPPPRAPRFLERLPPSWGGRLRALEMEDHYVRAHGPGGRSELILMRMRDAEVELAGIDGLRVHRSWWVARAAVSGRRRDGRNVVLLLGDDLEAPVARERTAALKTAGWLD